MHELDIKRRRLSDYLSRHGLDGVLLSTRAWFAWATGGRVNRIVNASPAGVASVLMTPETSVCLTNTIEGPRFRDEELAGLGMEVVEFPWYDAATRRRVAGQLLGGRKVACDVDEWGLGLPALKGDFTALRLTMTTEEKERYRTGGRLASEAIEAAAWDVKPGMTEFDAAGILTWHVQRLGLNPVVTLVASDERIRRFRHPIPVDRRIGRHVMLVNCSEHAGLVTSVTRFVHFGAMDAELVRRQRAVAEVDAVVNLATRPGRTFGEVFNDLVNAYEREGFGEEWKLHHQGGSAGYAPRETVATPGDPTKVLDDQPFAWNPSITGAKSEDTVLVTGGGVEVLSAASKDWPKIQTRLGMDRPDMLVV